MTDSEILDRFEALDRENSELRKRISDLRVEFEDDVNRINRRIETDFRELRNDIQDLERRH